MHINAGLRIVPYAPAAVRKAAVVGTAVAGVFLIEDIIELAHEA